MTGVIRGHELLKRAQPRLHLLHADGQGVNLSHSHGFRQARGQVEFSHPFGFSHQIAEGSAQAPGKPERQHHPHRQGHQTQTEDKAGGALHTRHKVVLWYDHPDRPWGPGPARRNQPHQVADAVAPHRSARHRPWFLACRHQQQVQAFGHQFVLQLIQGREAFQALLRGEESVQVGIGHDAGLLSPSLLHQEGVAVLRHPDATDVATQFAHTQIHHHHAHHVLAVVVERHGIADAHRGHVHCPFQQVSATPHAPLLRADFFVDQSSARVKGGLRVFENHPRFVPKGHQILAAVRAGLPARAVGALHHERAIGPPDDAYGFTRGVHDVARGTELRVRSHHFKELPP